MPFTAGQATELLNELDAGDGTAAETLLPLIQDELRGLARSLLRERPGHTLQTTALIDDAFIRLIRQREVHWQSRARFYALAALAIRRILVDHVRRRRAARRGGDWNRINLGDAEALAPGLDVDLLALEDALNKLAQLDARQAKVVELRFFGGLGVEETAMVLDVSPRTVESDWHMARAWLRRELE